MNHTFAQSGESSSPRSDCPHNLIQGDNYGETCVDCGKVISGYGYWAEGSNECTHRFLPSGSDNERRVCVFCEVEE
jgi:hypothetical protein